MNINIEDYEEIDILSISHNKNEQKFYDLTVEDDHSFYINLDGNEILTHNCDGNHISGLLILLFKKFWSDLLLNGKIQILKTPVVITTYKNKKYNFVSENDYNDFIADKKGYTTKYCKGLGGHDSKSFKEFLSKEDWFVTVDYDSERDDDLLSMAFDSKRANDRKIWVN